MRYSRSFSLQFFSPSDSKLQADRTRLLYDEFGTGAHGYGTWSAGNVPSQNVLSAEEVEREQEALDGITRWASEYDNPPYEKTTDQPQY